MGEVHRGVVRVVHGGRRSRRQRGRLPPMRARPDEPPLEPVPRHGLRHGLGDPRLRADARRLPLRGGHVQRGTAGAPRSYRDLGRDMGDASARCAGSSALRRGSHRAPAGVPRGPGGWCRGRGVPVLPRRGRGAAVRRRGGAAPARHDPREPLRAIRDRACARPVVARRLDRVQGAAVRRGRDRGRAALRVGPPSERAPWARVRVRVGVRRPPDHRGRAGAVQPARRRGDLRRGLALARQTRGSSQYELRVRL